MDTRIPLVSVVVLTYNSEQFILRTLNSVLIQDYERIELIISDDGSNDNTCEIIDDWLYQNGSSFEKCWLVKSFTNKGTCKNYNQGVINSHGDYIKTLDGDDLLKGPDSISRYISYIRDTNHEICISDVSVFSDEDYELSYYEDYYHRYFECVKESLPEQKKRIIRELSLPDPGVFFSRKLYDSVGGFDESYKLQEEWPFFMKVLDNDYHIGAIEQKLVSYRITTQAATHGKERKSYVKRMCVKDNLVFLIKGRFKRLLKEKEYVLAFKQLYRYLLEFVGQL